MDSVGCEDGARIARHVVDDPNRQADAIAGWTQQYDQLSTGAFVGTLTEWQTEGLHFFSETTSQALRQACRVRSGAIWFGIPAMTHEGQAVGDVGQPARPGYVSAAYPPELQGQTGGAGSGRADIEPRTSEMSAIHDRARRADFRTLRSGHDGASFSDPSLSGAMKIGARTVERDMVACQPGDRDFELVTPTQFRIFGIVITEVAWRDFMQQEYGCPDASPCIQDDLVRFDSEALDALRQVMFRVLCDAGDAGANGLLSDFQAAHFQDEVLRLLAGGLLQTANVAPVPALSKPHRRWLVDAARQYVLTHRERPIGIPELCGVLRASRRTLQYCFQDIYGMSPQRYLRATRLNGVRRALLQPVGDASAASSAADRGLPRSAVTPSRQTVQEIAAEWGFWHHSQFTADYRQLFGMTPSETQRRGATPRN